MTPEALPLVAESLEADTLNLRELADLHDDLAALRADLKGHVADIEAMLVDIARRFLEDLGEGAHGVPGVGEVRVAVQSRHRGWQHDEVVAALRRAAVDQATGEINFERAYEALAECAQWSGWKVAARRKWGVELSEFCETVRTPKVEVRREGA